MSRQVELHAKMIIHAYDDVVSELVGKAVVLTDGKAGTVEKIWLDELHGLRISINGHPGKWPISTLKFVQGGHARRLIPDTADDIRAHARLHAFRRLRCGSSVTNAVL